MRTLVVSFCLLLSTVAVPAFAANVPDQKVAYSAWEALHEIERRHQIPHGLLQSMSLVETGQGLEGFLMPWPYVANVNRSKKVSVNDAQGLSKEVERLKTYGFKKFTVLTGRGVTLKSISEKAVDALGAGATAWPIVLRGDGFAKRFKTKSEGVRFVESLISGGHTNVDIGLMQVNWYYHGENFKNVAEAFDPYKNASYAVTYLMEHRQTRDWWGSVGRYHSGTGHHAKRYVKSVWGMYQKVHRISPDKG